MKKRWLLTFACVCMIGLTGCGQDAKKLNNTGIEYFNNSEYEKAANAFLKAAVADKENNPEYFVNLGMARFELGNYEGAIEAYNNALSYDNSNAEAYKGRGIVYYFSGEYSLAMKDFALLIKNAGENFDETTLGAMEYYAALQTYYKDNAGALDTYGLLIRKGHNLAQQYFLRGSIYAAQGMETEAVLDYEQALKLFEDSGSENDNYEIYYNIYTDFMKAGFPDRAKSYLKRALSVEGASNLLKGKTSYIIEDYDNAAKFLAKAESEGVAEAEYYLAMAYEKLGKVEEALSMYESYLKAYPNDAKAYNQFGMYYMNNKDYQSALSCFIKGIALGNDDAKQELLFNEACCYEYMNDFATAYTKFESYLESYPNDAAAIHEYEFLSTR